MQTRFESVPTHEVAFDFIAFGAQDLIAISTELPVECARHMPPACASPNQVGPSKTDEPSATAVSAVSPVERHAKQARLTPPWHSAENRPSSLSPRVTWSEEFAQPAGGLASHARSKRSELSVHRRRPIYWGNGHRLRESKVWRRVGRAELLWWRARSCR